jgi:hypothetical protein
MGGCNPAHTSMEERLKLSRYSKAEEVDVMQYRCLVGSRFMERPTTKHQQAIKRILRFVAGTFDYGLRYEQCPGASHFVGYCDSDLTGDIDTSKSTSGVLFFLGNCLVSWQSLKQRVVALSSCEAEYIAATSTVTQALWLACLLGELLGRKTETVELKVDSKHIRIKYHLIRGCLKEGSVKASYIGPRANSLTFSRSHLGE